MKLAERIQYLRKMKGISQEELAEKAGVSRQAVSKWESDQSTPDVEKIIIMSDYFGVTTDYILKGIQTVESKEQKSRELASKVLYISSAAFVVIGLFCAFGGWYAQQTMEAVWGAMIVQVVGIAGFFIASILSREKAPIYIAWILINGIVFMPVSIMTGYIADLVFRQGWISPYPIGIVHTLAFAVVYLSVLIMSYFILKKRQENAVDIQKFY